MSFKPDPVIGQIVVVSMLVGGLLTWWALWLFGHLK